MPAQTAPEEPKPKGKRGGARPGAGRKKGVPNKTTQGHKERLANAGQPDPVDLLVFKANYYAARAQRLITAAANPNTAASAKQSDIDDALERMEAAAVKAAPYFRNRLATLNVTGGLKLDLTKASDEQLAFLEELIRAGVAVSRGDTGGAAETRH